MIIKATTAMRLVRDGKATIIGRTVDESREYAIVNRHDLARTDHVLMPDTTRFLTPEERAVVKLSKALTPRPAAEPPASA